MVRYSFLVGLFHPRLHAGLSRRLRLLTRAAPKCVFVLAATYRAATVTLLAGTPARFPPLAGSTELARAVARNNSGKLWPRPPSSPT